MYSTSNSSVVKHCQQCGAEFTPHPFVGKRQRFCSDACRNAAQAKCYRASIVCTCRHCGKQFQPKKIDRDQYCSRECAFAYRQLHGFPERRKPTAQPQSLLTCEICGKPCKRKGAKTCSDECRKEHKRRTSREWYESQSQRDRSPRPCKECGKTFVPEYGNKRRVYCSGKCMRRAGKRSSRKLTGTFNHTARKRLRLMHGDSWRSMYETINKRRVFERDKWKCQLCGRKVKRTNKWNPLQATIDHIVPLALGGEHKYTNVQTACMECNSKKGATIQGQQRVVG